MVHKDSMCTRILSVSMAVVTGLSTVQRSLHLRQSQKFRPSHSMRQAEFRAEGLHVGEAVLTGLGFRGFRVYGLAKILEMKPDQLNATNLPS